MTHDDKIAFEEANEDIFTQQQDERDETLDEYISRFVTHCRDNGYYLTYNAKGDPVFSSEAKGVKEAPAKALVRGFKKYANNLGYRGAYPKDCSFRVQGALVDGLTYVEHTFFEPGAAEFKTADASCGIYALNTWKPFRDSGVKPVGGDAPDLEVFLTRARHIFGEHTDLHLDRLAYMVQYPGRRLPQYEYVMGSQGCGKSTYYTYYILPLFSGQYQKVNKLPTGRFDLSNYKEVEFALFDDPKGSESARQELKAVLTESELGAEAKYGAIEKQALHFNSALLCNPEQRFPIHSEDRRPFVVIAQDWDYETFRNDIEIPELIRCGEDPDRPGEHGAYIDALHDFLLYREIDVREVARIVRTEDFHVVAGMDLTDAVAIMEAAELYSVVTTAKIQEVMQYDPRQKPNFNRIGEVLRDHGWIQCRVKFNDREKPSAWYNPKDFPEGKPQNKELRALFNLERLDDMGTTDQTSEDIVDDVQTPATLLESVDPVTEDGFEPPEELQAAFANDEPDTNDCKESYMVYVPDEYMSEDFRNRLIPPKDVPQGFWMWENGVKVWYDPAVGSGEKPVELIPDDQLPACMCA
ncbi:hypothetical protein SHB42_004815 [Escherichia coli]|nr:hypothetical protein [Escherichia coli]